MNLWILVEQIKGKYGQAVKDEAVSKFFMFKKGLNFV